jgi:hypothetical protein
MDINWSSIDRTAWDSAHATALAAYQQDWAYGDAMLSLGTECVRCWVTDADGVIAFAQFIIRRIAGVVPVALCTRGPVWARPASPALKYQTLRLMQRSAPYKRPRLTLFSPDETDTLAAGVARMHRVMTGYATAVLNLDPDLAQLRLSTTAKWKNRLNRAEASEIRIERSGIKPNQYQWILTQEETQRQSKAYKALPLSLVAAYQSAYQGPGQALLTLRASLGKELIGGVLFLRHGNAATYHIGWADSQKRIPGVHNLLIWQAIIQLKESGVRLIDLGGINTQRGAGIALFKMSTGAQVKILTGTHF